METYERILAENPDNAKALQKLGWLHHQDSSEPFQNQELAIQYLTKSLEAGTCLRGVLRCPEMNVLPDPSDADSWNMLGRAYVASLMYKKAYKAYHQTALSHGHNSTFWCSIGVLYSQVNQSLDAFDAYSRAIRINPHVPEVWFNLGSLYESNNQTSDAIYGYAHAAELAPNNPTITQRLQLLKTTHTTEDQLPDPAASILPPIAELVPKAS